MPGFKTQRSFFDPKQDSGYWSPSTSSSNFCEEDYIVTHYISEFINTLSNLAYIYYAFYPPSSLASFGANVQGDEHGRELTRLQFRSRSSLDVHTISLILIGLSSASFHLTTRTLPQLLDESSMYLMAALWIHALLTTTYVESPPAKDKPVQRYEVSRRNKFSTATLLVLILILASAASIQTGNLAIHSIIFAILLVLSGIKLLYLIILATPSIQENNSSNNGGHRKTMSKARRMLLASLARAIAFLVIGFTLWLLDCEPTVCAHLRYLRNDILGRRWYLRPLSYLTELHGWWHVLTARAAGEYIVLVRVLTTETRT